MQESIIGSIKDLAYIVESIGQRIADIEQTIVRLETENAELKQRVHALENPPYTVSLT